MFSIQTKLAKTTEKDRKAWEKTPLLEVQHTLRLMRWQIQAAFCLLTDHLNINGQKTCRFLSVKLFLKRWLHWNITAATNGDKMKHINLGHQNCNQPTSHQPVQREEEIISSILFPELFQIKIHNLELCFASVICNWTTEPCLMLLLSPVVMMVPVHSDKRWMCLLCSGRRVR